eukprot:6876781-Pyramimonas_sp.AAC.1
MIDLDGPQVAIRGERKLVFTWYASASPSRVSSEVQLMEKNFLVRESFLASTCFTEDTLLGAAR